MSDLDARLEEALAHIRELKEDSVRKHPDDPDLLSSIQVYRGGDKVAVLGCEPDRDVQLWLLKLAIVGMDADEVTFSMETCHTKHMLNPGTGQPWVNGEMQQVLRSKPDWYVAGMIQEGITTFCWTRAGEMKATSQEFEIEDNKVKWLPTQFTTEANGEVEGGKLWGFIHEEVSLMWLEESSMSVVLQQAKALGLGKLYEGKSEVQLRTDADIAVARFIMMSPAPAFCGLMSSPDPEDERTKILMAAKGWNKDLSHTPEPE